jgi:hypothetical protein
MNTLSVCCTCDRDRRDQHCRICQLGLLRDSPGYLAEQHNKTGVIMIALGVILLILGFLLKISILWTIGIILLVVGAVLFLLGSVGRPVMGRRHFF